MGVALLRGPLWKLRGAFFIDIVTGAPMVVSEGQEVRHGTAW